MFSVAHFFASQQITGTVYIPYSEIAIVIEDNQLFGNINSDTLIAELPYDELSCNIDINELDCELHIESEAEIV